MKCVQCGIEFKPERASTAKYCSPNCKTIYNRKVSVTPSDGKISVTLPKELSVTFKFTTKYNKKPGVEGYDEDTDKRSTQVREAKYWYDVPLGAIPIIQTDWPEMPEFMNGRQYFLWWKNEFKTQNESSSARFGSPQLLNPFPILASTQYINAGEGSRRWGS